MERAAPIPVPVHMRMPRLYRVDVLETPANWKYRFHMRNFLTTSSIIHTFSSRVQSVLGGFCTRLRVKSPRVSNYYYKSPFVNGLTYLGLQRSCSGILRAGSHCIVTDYEYVIYEYSLHSRDNSESVIFHDRRATDSSKQPLLHSPLESNDSYFC